MRRTLIGLAILALVSVHSGETFARPSPTRATAVRARFNAARSSAVKVFGAALLFFAAGCESRPTPPPAKTAAPRGAITFGPGNSVHTEASGPNGSYSESHAGPQGRGGTVQAW